MLNNILILEDSKTLNRIIKAKLKDLCQNIDQAYTLKEATKFLEEKEYELIILDLHLPDGEGLDLLCDIKSLTETKIIVLTSYQDDALREELFKNGVLDYIIKDSNFIYSISEIIKVIDHITSETKDKILIIDDSKFICKQVKTILEPRNYIIETAHSAEDGLNKLDNENFNLIILDMELPDMHGSEVLKIIRNGDRYLTIPIIVLSGTANSNIVRDFLKNGANDYLKKPFIYEEFILKVDLWIDYYKKEQELIETTKQLKFMNDNLNELVKKEVEANRKKDELMSIQSRHSQMGEMIAMIAHQWRQPLNSLSAAVTLMDMKVNNNVLNPTMTKTILSKMNKYIKYMSTTIDDFKDFFKPQKEMKSSNFKKIFYKAYKLIESSLKNKNIKIDVYINNIQNFKTYENELVQVIINLLKNAMDAFDENNVDDPKIEVKIENNYISIKDNAGGIPKNIIDKIFDPYFSTKSKNGTGLGLYMSKIIVEDHCKGKLTIENSDYGAQFTILLPIRE